MAENPVEPTTKTAPAPVQEPVVAPTPPKIEEESLIGNEEVETKIEVEDEEKMEQPENRFDELDEDLTDLGGTADTIWLLRRVGAGIIKILIVLGALGMVGWLIWGGEGRENLKQVFPEKQVVEQEVEDIKGSMKEIFFPKQEQEGASMIATAPIAMSNTAGRSLTTWNYWIETQRISSQKGTPAKVLLWKREVEVLFEIPFPQQINGKTSIVRNHQVGRSLQVIDRLLSRAGVLQGTLSQDIIEFSNKAMAARNASMEIEQQFVDALRDSNPVGISLILDRKIEAEKDIQKYSVDAEARQIFTQKVSEYSLVLENLKTILTMNRAAIAQDIQVVNFPSDPFGRVIAPGAWTPHQ